VSPLRRGLLVGLAVPLAMLAATPARAASQGSKTTVVVIYAPDASLGDLLSVGAIRAVAHAGGAGFASSNVGMKTVIDRALNERFSPNQPGFAPAQPSSFVLPRIPDVGAPNRVAALQKTDATVRRIVTGEGGSGPCLVVVTPPALSTAMIAAKDELSAVVAGNGSNCEDLLTADGPSRTITSDSSRRVGIIAQPDVPFTILTALGRTPAIGATIRFVDSPPPLHLYEKHLANRRMSVPIQTAAGVYVGLAGLLGVAILYFRRRAPRWLKFVAAWAAMSVPALAVALLAAGRLPTLSYATVVPFLVVGTAAGTVAFDPLRRRDVLLVPTAVGAAVLVYFVVEAIFNWSAALTPFLGGSELDGGRFFGLPNVYVGLLLGASLYVAQRLALTPGVALIVAVGFFAGLPGIGANLGGALTLFSAAGMWLIVRAHERLGWGRSIAIAAAIVVVGMAAVFASHEFLTATPTHGTRFVEGAGRSVTGIWGTITHRLGVGFDLIARNPFALLPVLGVPACLYVVLRPTPSIRGSFERRPVWRDALLVILLGSVVAYAANDSGAAAVGLGFGLAIGGMLYVPLADEAGNMEAA
jgi:hypothetical protein